MMEDHQELSPWHKIAVLFVVLGEELSGRLMQYFGEAEVELVTRAITDLKNVPTQLQDEVLREFEDLLQGDIPAQGGVDFVSKMLNQALGAQRAEEILGRLGQPQSGFKLLKDADPVQVAPFLAQEHPQTLALILSQLEAAQAAAFLGQWPAALQGDVAHRIATLENIQPEILQDVEASLETMLRDVLGGNRNVGGSKVVADILNLTGASMEKRVLDRLDASAPEVAEEVRSRMFGFDDLAGLSDDDMRLVLQSVDPQDLLISLKSAGKGVRDKIFTCMSERRRVQLLEDLAVLPKMRLSEVEEVQGRMVQLVRQLEEQGVVHLARGGADDTYV